MKLKRKPITSLLLLVALTLTVTLLPANAVTVQAAKKATTYKVVYKLNGGTNNKANPKKLKKNKSVKLKAPTKNGYTFKGWYKDKKFKTKTTKVKGTKSAKNRTVYAKWVKNPAAPVPEKPDESTKPTEPEKPGKPEKPDGTPSKPTTPDKDNTGNTGNTGSNTGNTGDTSTPGGNSGNSSNNTGNNNATIVPSEPLENPADMYCIDGKNNTHDWAVHYKSAGLEYICACGFNVSDLYTAAYKAGNYDLANKYYYCGTNDPWLYEDEKMPCPGCGGWCNSDAGWDGIKIVNNPNIVDVETKCMRCGQILPKYWVSISKH